MKSRDNSEPNNKIQCSVHIVPWALPNEEIPIHINLGKERRFNEIRVTIPPSFAFIDFINVSEVAIAKNIARIKRINKTSRDADIYFGVVVKCTKIFDGISSAGRIKIDCQKDGTKASTEVYARIFRPLLEITRAPKTIELTDDSPVKVPLQIKYIGFGDIQLKIEAIIGGKIVSYGESLVVDLLERLMQTGFTEREIGENVTSEKKKPEVKVNPEYIKELSEEMIERIKKGSVPKEMKGENLERLRSILSDEEMRKKWMEVLLHHVEGLLLNLLLESFDRNPTNNVKLSDSKTKIHAEIKLPVEKIKIRILYRDLIGNEYTPVETTTIIEDRRKVGKATLIEIPINIEKWENKPLMNVKEMKIGNED